MAEKDPLNASYFMVDVPGVTNAHFREASGFTTETNVITTAMVGKDGKTVQKQIPGIMKLSPITFKRGLSDNMDLWKWRKLVEEGKIEEARKNVSVVAYSTENKEVARWSLEAAWCSKLTGPSLDAKSNEVGIEDITIVFESYKREK